MFKRKFSGGMLVQFGRYGLGIYHLVPQQPIAIHEVPVSQYFLANCSAADTFVQLRRCAAATGAAELCHAN